MENFINSIKKSTECINENKYFIGIAMILLNIGARFIIDELDDDLRKMISNKFIRRLFIFCSFFMATRDLFTAVILPAASLDGITTNVLSLEVHESETMRADTDNQYLHPWYRHLDRNELKKPKPTE